MPPVAVGAPPSMLLEPPVPPGLVALLPVSVLPPHPTTRAENAAEYHRLSILELLNAPGRSEWQHKLCHVPIPQGNSDLLGRVCQPVPTAVAHTSRFILRPDDHVVTARIPPYRPNPNRRLCHPRFPLAAVGVDFCRLPAASASVSAGCRLHRPEQGTGQHIADSTSDHTIADYGFGLSRRWGLCMKRGRAGRSRLGLRYCGRGAGRSAIYGVVWWAGVWVGEAVGAGIGLS